MIITYGRFGVYANIALVVNAFMILAIMGIFGSALTLPGRNAPTFPLNTLRALTFIFALLSPVCRDRDALYHLLHKKSLAAEPPC